ncbi:MAG: hypothetical protein GQ582_13210, partial [Methyloprofundus sp.]|nr:hypothetical protein [Methyloprofundus sp.]
MMTKLFQYTNLILLLLLNGCSGGTTGLKLTLGYDKDKQLLPQVNMDAKADNHWFENSSFFDGADVTERYKGTVTSSIAHYLDEGGVYFIDDKPSIQYLNSVVDKLLSGWDGPKVDYSILIKEDSEFDAVADEYGQIILTIGAFNKVSSDD